MTAESSQFECASCGGDFEKTRSDEEALVEAQFVWGKPLEPNECSVVCEECFTRIMTWEGRAIGRA